MSLCALVSGITVHPSELWDVYYWFRFASPTQWAIQLLAAQEFYGRTAYFSSNDAVVNSHELQFKCVPKTITQNSQGFEIVTASRCSNTTGSQVMAFAGLTMPEIDGYSEGFTPYEFGLSIIASWGIVGLIFNCMLINCNHRSKLKMRHRD